MASVGLRLIDRLRHFIDHFTKQSMKGLRRSEVNTVSGGDLNDRLVVRVDDSLAKAQINDAVMVPQFGEHINIGNRHPVISYLPPIGPDGQLATASYNDFIIRHQKPPIGKMQDLTGQAIASR